MAIMHYFILILNYYNFVARLSRCNSSHMMKILLLKITIFQL